MIHYFPDGKFSASHFGRCLIELLDNNTSLEDIGKWTYDVFHQYNASGEIRDKLMSLMFMEEGKNLSCQRKKYFKLRMN
jgi:hypothetical protein